MSDTRRRLDDLMTSARPRRQASAPLAPTPTSLKETVGGRETTCHKLRYWSIETPFTAICPQHQTTATRLDAPLRHAGGAGSTVTIRPQQAVVVDVETGGFAGMPVFLIGVVLLERRPLRVLQLLARDYPEEEAILRGFAKLAAKRDTWVTFNGKSFDEPFLRDRATLHRVSLTPPNAHVDLLHASRRAWRGQVPNFRLGTLEAHILKRPRVGDVPSCDVPDLFHHFIRTGNAAPLRPVLAHNCVDLVSSTELLLRLSQT